MASKNPDTTPTKVRVLRDHGEYSCNQVVTLGADEASAAVDGGWGDVNPDAVTYAEALAPAAQEAPAA